MRSLSQEIESRAFWGPDPNTTTVRSLQNCYSMYSETRFHLGPGIEESVSPSQPAPRPQTKVGVQKINGP